MIELNDFTAEALRSLCPSGWAWNGGDIKVVSDPKPTDAEIQSEMDRLEAEYDAQAYARSRQTEYPTIQECVHAILDNDNNELDTLQAKRAEIKLKYPKGG